MLFFTRFHKFAHQKTKPKPCKARYYLRLNLFRLTFSSGETMKIKDYKDFYSGMMFLVIGVLSVWLSQSYNLGTSARMGPGYFPTVLGGILAVIGFLVALKSLGKVEGDHSEAKGAIGPIVVFVAMMVFSIIAGLLGASPNMSLALGTVAGCVLAYFLDMKALGLILGAITVFGLVLKLVGLVISTVMLVAIASLASHELRRKEAVISAVLLAAFAVGVFIYGIKLQIPIWPDVPEIQRTFAPAPAKVEEQKEKK